MTAGELIRELVTWQAAGWLRPLDLAFARFLHEADAEVAPDLLLAAALLSRLEADGHSALPLDDLAGSVADLLDWPTEALNALSSALAARPLQPLQPSTWRQARVVEIDPVDAAGATPLVVSGGRLALRRHWRDEARIAEALRARAGEPLPVDEHLAGDWLARLFPARAGAGIDWQQHAGEVALRGRYTLVTGGPGTGKTWTAARLLVLLQVLRGDHGAGSAALPPLRVGLAAPTGKAAARLKQSLQQALQGLRPALGPLAAQALDPWAEQLPPARTLHALLGTRPGTRRFRHDAANPLPLDLLFVDEASMVHLDLMARLLEALPPQARLVLLGDPHQLASVEAGAVLADLCDAPLLAPRTVALRESRRFQGDIGALAQAVHADDGDASLALLRAADSTAVALNVPQTAADLLPLAVEGYRAMLAALQGINSPAERAPAERAQAALQAFEGFRLLCGLREGPWGVEGLNAAVEAALADAGLLPRRRGEWYTGRPVMLLRNQPALGLFNGDIGLVLPGDDGTPRVWFAEGEALRAVAVGRLEQVQTAFAMTVHKSQGSEFGHVTLVLPSDDGPLLTRELVYTGLTRARERFTLVAPEPALFARAVGRRMRRLGGLKDRLLR
ncbi:MAG: exodeoxyribonuclease V subunit alpha [Burkholderiaceae bacterium]|nr:exodeoxyribonuclease V subunit alpha [Burkholderiaceae bacterium]